MSIEELIHRAASALCYDTEDEFIAVLVAEGVSAETAFLAVKAGAVYNKMAAR